MALFSFLSSLTSVALILIKLKSSVLFLPSSVIRCLSHCCVLGLDLCLTSSLALCLSSWVKGQLHTIWWDNFNRAFAVNMQSVIKDAHALCNWTGMAMRIPDASLDTSGISLQLVPDQPAFPSENIFADEFWKLAGLTWRLKQATTPAGISKFEAGNWTVIHNVNRIPVKALVDKRRFPETHKRSDEGRTGLKNFFPTEMSSENIGSNLGLLALLKTEMDAHLARADADKVYRVIISDCNIFNRIVKVQYFAFHSYFHPRLQHCTLTTARMPHTEHARAEEGNQQSQWGLTVGTWHAGIQPDSVWINVNRYAHLIRDIAVNVCPIGTSSSIATTFRVLCSPG
jgi:hypothetical protein